MSKFEESRPHHEVHQIGHPQGHGLMDQKLHKGNRSPIVSAIPKVDDGTVPGPNGMGSPGSPQGEYGNVDNTGGPFQ